MKRITGFLIALFLGLFSSSFAEALPVDYGDSRNWAYMERSFGDDKKADVFFIAPTVYLGTAEKPVMELTNDKAKRRFVGAVTMEKGIYDGPCRFFAPYYRQISLKCYGLSLADRQPYLEFAYKDVRDAFQYYLKHWNQGRPIILAGFSQGGEMCMRLLKDQFSGTDLMKRLIACYAIGWKVRPSDLDAFRDLKMASSENDLGVIISFNSEAEDVTDSLSVPAGTVTLSVNPLNWKNDGTPADKSMNLGACFTDYTGKIVREIPCLTGAYIAEGRGTLKVTDVDPEEYKPKLKLFRKGVYHLLDYQFFYRNLQKNVEVRVKAFSEQMS